MSIVKLIYEKGTSSEILKPYIIAMPKCRDSARELLYAISEFDGIH